VRNDVYTTSGSKPSGKSADDRRLRALLRVKGIASRAAPTCAANWHTPAARPNLFAGYALYDLAR